ncbi:helix-turn-helix domain-containing protein [Streptomyces sp. I8-5]|uniref:helix-turn-helix domain-containing protein n=1 Tax=Streptomyces sp. I8-5 TaxID=3104277 RepID=UPI00386E7603
MVDPAEAVQRLRWLHDERGLTYQTIEAGTGVSVRTLLRVYSNPPDVQARTRDAILGYNPDHPPQWVPAHGVQRRGRALYAMGYTFTHVAAVVGIRECQYHYMITKAVVRVTGAYAHTLADTYEHLAHTTTPETEGIAPPSAMRARNIARKRGYAPPGCWDTDTIDDPDAFPEWTGACGTPEGRLIHRRESTPVCAPCRTTYGESAALPPFRHDELKRLTRAHGLTAATLAGHIGMSSDTVHRWWSGERTPRRQARQQLAHVLGVDVTDLEGPTP